MPPQRLTPTLVRSLPTTGERYEVRDSVADGLVLRVGARGDKSWSYVYTRHGKNQRVTLGPLEDLDLPAARERARAERLKVLGGQHPARQKRTERRHGEHTVGSLLDKMFERLPLRPSTRREWMRIASTDLEPLRHRAADDVTDGDVMDLLDAIGRRSGSAAGHAFDVLRRAYSFARSLRLVGASPCTGLENPHKGQPSERVLCTAELRALWRALDVLGTGQYADAVRLLMLTGVRKDGVLGARAREFEGVRREDLGAGENGTAVLAGARRLGQAAPCESSPHAGADAGAGRAVPHRALHSDASGQAVALWTVPPERNKGRGKGRPHVVPLSPQAQAVVRRRLDASEDYLFPTHYMRRDGQEPGPYMTITSAWVRHLELVMAYCLWEDQRGREDIGPALAHVPDWHLHNLRHTMATLMVELLGVDETVADLVLGHVPPTRKGSAKVYQRAQRLPERRAALNLWGAWVEGLVSEQTNVLPMRR